MLLLLLVSACGVPTEPAAGPAAAASPGPLPPLQTRAEGDVAAPCGALWLEGEQVSLRGLYRTAGEQAYLDVWRIAEDGVSCWARFFLDKDLGLGAVHWEEPLYLQVSGRPQVGRWSSPGLWDLQVAEWSELAYDAGAARQSCRGAAATLSAELQGLDWAALALPSYYTATAGFRPSAGDLSELQIQIVGADERRPILLLEAKGPLLPQSRTLVYRWMALECHYDLEWGQVVALVATVRGEVQE